MRIQKFTIAYRFLVAVSLTGTATVSQAQVAPDISKLVQGVQGATQSATPDATPTAQAPVNATAVAAELQQSDQLQKELRDIKKKDAGLRRFAEDLFEYRQPFAGATEGGISEDYVLGPGDQLILNVVGSAAFDLPLAVDARGEVVIPKLGSVKVSGLTLAKARAAVQTRVSQNFSRTTADLSVTKLRDIRIFVLGEVYKPGAYLVPSLSSLVNILGLTGGPTRQGTFRQIRVMRGGKVVHQVDLYPLRAEGLGNVNFSFQSGDVVFVPLAFNGVTLEGGFTRVSLGAKDQDFRQVLRDEVKAEKSVGEQKVTAETPLVGEAAKQVVLKDIKAGGGTGKEVLPESLRKSIPLMHFELLPGEKVADAVRYAGGLLPEAYPDTLSLRRQDKEGLTDVLDVPVAEWAATPLFRGDVLSAFPRRDRMARMVSVVGWGRIEGAFGRAEGLRVGDLLKRDRQVLPDTYLGRAEIVRTAADGTTHFLAFDLGKALQGDPKENLLLEDRDRIELFPMEKLRLPRRVLLEGPVTTPGGFDLHEGMRVSDLVFKGGVLKREANHFYAELARFKDGSTSEIIRLDLGKLSSSESQSSVGFVDDAANPLLKPDDRVTLYEKPEFRLHRTIRVSGQVVRPGTYVIDVAKPTLSQVIARAGGLTPEAMPEAGLLFRRLGADDVQGEKVSGAVGISEILDRLSETKMLMEPSLVGGATTPKLFRPPVLHGLDLSRDNRLVVDFSLALKGDVAHDVEMQNEDSVFIPKRTDSVMVIGESATPYAFYKVTPGMSVSDLLKLAGGTTRNADTRNIRLLKANGKIVDDWFRQAKVEPGDALLIPQRIRRDSTWQENLQALTPFALILNAIR